MKMKPFKLLTWVIALGILIGACVYTFSRSDVSDFVRLAGTINPLWIVVMASTELGTYVCTSVMYRVMFRALGVQVALPRLLPLSMEKLAVDQFIPTAGVGGSALVVHGLRREGIDRQTAVAMVVLGLAAWYLAGDIAGAYGLARIAHQPVVLASAVPIAGVYAAVSLFIVYFTLRGIRSKGFAKMKRILPGKKLDVFFSELVSTHELGLAKKVGFARIVLAQMAIVALDAGTLTLACLAVGSPMNYGVVLACYALVNMAATVSILPGGIGVFEGGLIALLSLFGMEPAAALAATVLYRGFSVWLPMVPGVILARRELARHDQDQNVV